MIEMPRFGTKILATIGPASGKYEIIRRLICEGVNGFRINYSHGSPAIWDEWIKLVNDVMSELNTTVSIIGDLPGPQIRIGELPSHALKAKEKVTLVFKDKTDEEKTIPVPIKKFFEALELGDTVLVDDGKIVLRIVDAGEDWAEALVLNDAEIRPRKTIVIFGKEIDLPVLTDKDIEFVKYSVARNITYIALSYVRKANDVSILRDLLSRFGGDNIGIIAKIETRSGVRNLASIINAADAIIIARGDLGMHFSLEELPFLQKKIAREAIMHGKPCIVATQLLESMINYPRPSRSEVVDVINAVYDLVDAVLLTNETAIGKYPVETVKWINRIINSADPNMVYDRVNKIRENIKIKTLKEKYTLGLTLLAEKIESKILIYTKTGSTPALLSKYRPRVPVYVGSTDKNIIEKLTLYYGLKPYYISDVSKSIDYDQGMRLLYNLLKENTEINYGDIIAEAYGRREAEIHEIKIRQVI